MGGNQVFGKIELERKYGLSYHNISPRWLRFTVYLNGRILPNQRGFFNFIPLEFGINRGIGIYRRGDLISGLLSVDSRWSKQATADFVVKGGQQSLKPTLTNEDVGHKR